MIKDLLGDIQFLNIGFLVKLIDLQQLDQVVLFLQQPLLMMIMMQVMMGVWILRIL